MPDIINNLIDYLVFIFERLDWTSAIDILLVTVIFFVIFLLVRDTQAMVLLRGGLILLLLLGVLNYIKSFTCIFLAGGKHITCLISGNPSSFCTGNPACTRAIGTNRLIRLN